MTIHRLRTKLISEYPTFPGTAERAFKKLTRSLPISSAVCSFLAMSTIVTRLWRSQPKYSWSSLPPGQLPSSRRFSASVSMAARLVRHS